MHSDWAPITLGDVIDQGRAIILTGPFGTQLHAHDYEPIGVPVIPTNAIRRRLVDTKGLPRVSAATAKRLARYRVRSGDILFARRGAQATGLSALVRAEQTGWIAGTGVIVLRLQSKHIDQQFLSFALSSDAAVIWLKTHAVGAVMPNLNEGVIRRLPLQLPSLPEQEAIGHILGTLDDKIDLNRRMNATLEAMARALFQSWFVDFDPVRAKAEGRHPAGMDAETAALFPHEWEHAHPGAVPHRWRIGMLKDCCQRIESGGTPSRREPTFWTPPIVPWLTSGEVRPGIVVLNKHHISPSGLKYSSAKLWPEGTTVVALIGATAGQASLIACQMCSNQNCCGLVPYPNLEFYMYLHLSSLRPRLEQMASGSAQRSLNQQHLITFPILLPEAPILERFHMIVKPIFEIWKCSLQTTSLLESIRDALLPKLLSGEIRVRDADRELAALL